MRIVFITSKLNFSTAGGSVEEIDLIIRTLQKLGNEVSAVTVFSSNNKIPSTLPYTVFEEHIEATGFFGIQKAAFGLLKKYASQADWFHIDGHLLLYGAGLYRWLGGCVPVAALFNSYLASLPDNLITLFQYPHEGFFHRLRRLVRRLVERSFGMLLARRLDVCAFVSPPLKKVYEDFGLRARRHMVIGDLIDIKKLQAEAGMTAEDYVQRHTQTGVITLYYSSRMIRGKGFDLLIDGFSRVQHKERYRLIIGGTGPDELRVARMVERLGLEPYVHLPGWVSREDLLQYYKEADIFVQVGWKPEGTSISLLYAMAFGIPSIVPGGGGMAWQAGDAAAYVTNGNPDELALAIERLGADRSWREELSRCCVRRIKADELSYEKQVANLHSLLQTISDSRD